MHENTLLTPLVIVVGLLFNEAQYTRLAAIMERREGIAALIDAIETAQLAREGTAL